MKDSQIIDNDILLNMIDNHINEGIPSSFIRKGDGENIVIGYKKIDGIKFKDFNRMMRIMNVRLFNYKFQEFIRKSLVESFNNCNVLGISKENQRFGHWEIVKTQMAKCKMFRTQMLADLEDLAAMPMPSKDTAEDEVGGDPTNIQCKS